MNNVHDDGWPNYNRLVLKQLETLARNIDNLNKEFRGLREEMAQIKAQNDKIKDLKEWKEKIDEVCSPPQLKEMFKEIDELKLYKAKSITIFMVIQFLMASAIAMFEFLR